MILVTPPPFSSSSFTIKILRTTLFSISFENLIVNLEQRRNLECGSAQPSLFFLIKLNGICFQIKRKVAFLDIDIDNYDEDFVIKIEHR